MRAFALRADYSDFSGGSIALPPDGRTLDVGRRLKNGVVFAEDHVECEALSNYPALKELHGEELAAALSKAGDDEPSKADLVEKAKEMGLPTSGTKEELASRIADAEEGS